MDDDNDVDMAKGGEDNPFEDFDVTANGNDKPAEGDFPGGLQEEEEGVKDRNWDEERQAIIDWSREPCCGVCEHRDPPCDWDAFFKQQREALKAKEEELAANQGGMAGFAGIDSGDSSSESGTEGGKSSSAAGKKRDLKSRIVSGFKRAKGKSDKMIEDAGRSAIRGAKRAGRWLIKQATGVELLCKETAKEFKGCFSGGVNIYRSSRK